MCGLCGDQGYSERTLTRVEGLDICPFCIQDIGRDTRTDSIAMWPDALMFARFDRYPWRPQDY